MEQTGFVESVVSILLPSSRLIDKNRQSSENKIFVFQEDKQRKPGDESRRRQTTAQIGISVLTVLKRTRHSLKINSAEWPPLTIWTNT